MVRTCFSAQLPPPSSAHAHSCRAAPHACPPLLRWLSQPGVPRLQNLRKTLPSAEDESENCFPSRSKEISEVLMALRVEPAQLWRAYSESGVRAPGLRTHVETCLFQKSECTSLSHIFQDLQPLPVQSGFARYTNFGCIFQAEKQFRFPVLQPRPSTIAK